jgi:hypothetical protein
MPRWNFERGNFVLFQPFRILCRIGRVIAGAVGAEGRFMTLGEADGPLCYMELSLHGDFTLVYHIRTSGSRHNGGD